MKKVLVVESPDASVVTFDMCAEDSRCDGVITVVAPTRLMIVPHTLYIIAAVGHHSYTSKMMFNQAIAGIYATDELGGPGVVIKFVDGLAFEDQITIDEIHPDIANVFQKLFEYSMERVGESHLAFNRADTDWAWIGGKLDGTRN